MIPFFHSVQKSKCGEMPGWEKPYPRQSPEGPTIDFTFRTFGLIF